MQKLALSLLVVTASGVYVWDQSGQQGQPLASLDLPLAGSEAHAEDSSPDASVARGSPAIAADATAAADCAAGASAPIPAKELPPVAPTLPRTEIATAATETLVAQALVSGTYRGPVTDAYYGPMQIEAIVEQGKLVALRALQYPSDRRTSININRQALPMLRDEAIAAQSANVDIITGATLTSEAFIRSLRGALNQAGL